MKASYIIIFISTIILMSTCGKPVDITPEYNLDKDNHKIPKIAFEGKITNLIDSNCVKVKRTVSIHSNENIYIENAEIIISDNHGNIEQLQYVGNGRYQCLTTVGISDGRVYTMTAKVEGKTYTANLVMPAKPLPIDSVVIVPDENNEGKFKAIVFAMVHTQFREYYLFQNFVNGKLKNEPDDLLYASNENLNGKIPGFTLVEKLNSGDKFTYKYYTITKEVFDYYNGINDQVNSDGGVFSTPPANVVGNIPDAAGIIQGMYLYTDSLIVP
ncbi:MAG: DUF4249 family protein [Bacteroidota bacterium]|nr:DUF4249 family protein [Bacteroidota bacterium]